MSHQGRERRPQGQATNGRFFKGGEPYRPFQAQQRAGGTWTEGELRPLAASGRVQRKATVRPAGDAYEQEADSVACRVMGAPSNDAGAFEGKPVAGRISSLAVQRDPAGSGATPKVSDGLTNQLQAAKGGGRPLDKETRAFMEPRFGQDFSGVRVHTGGQAQDMAVQLKAKAFTHGSDVFMGRGHSDLKSESGKHLLAHELTHVVQQGGSGAVQRKPIIQRDPESGASALEPSAAAETVSEAPASDSRPPLTHDQGQDFMRSFMTAMVDISNTPARKNFGEVQATLAPLRAELGEVDAPRLEAMLNDTEAALGAIFATQPATFQDALSRSEAAQLLAYAEKSKWRVELDEARGKYDTMKRKTRGSKSYEKLGTKAMLPGARRKAQAALERFGLAKERYIGLFDSSMVPPNAVVFFLVRLSDAAVKEHGAGEPYDRLSTEYGIPGSIIPTLAAVVQAHVGRSVIGVYEAVSGLDFD